MSSVDPSLAAGIWAGLSAVAFDPSLWLMTLLGVFLGMTVGVLPGLGPPAAMALLFPLVYVLDPLPGISLLAGIFYGAKYGGAVTSVLLGIPGEADAVATLFEGHPLAMNGKARQALMLATMASFTGGMLAMAGMLLLAPILTEAALSFGPPGRAFIMLSALVLVIFTGPGGAIRNLCMVLLGLFLALIGTDPVYGTVRLSFGLWQLSSGIELTALLLGLFGLGDVLNAILDSPPCHDQSTAPSPPLNHVAAGLAALRGSIIGFVTGLVPCGAGVTASFTSYALEKKLTRHPEQFGKGAWEGLAGPEASNNASAISSFAPLLLLGLPTNPIMAALLGALTAVGVTPGPWLPEQQPVFYWGLIGSLALGNAFLLVLGLGLTSFWAKLAHLSPRLLWPMLVLLCLIGSYTSAESLTGPVQCLIFGLLAIFIRRMGCSPAPLVLAFVLGPRLETHLLQALMAIW